MPDDEDGPISVRPEDVDAFTENIPVCSIEVEADDMKVSPMNPLHYAREVKCKCGLRVIQVVDEMQTARKIREAFGDADFARNLLVAAHGGIDG